jgi:uncharacterized protein YegP (UPF0339 family)
MPNTSYYLMHKDNQGYWRWTFRAANGEAIAVSSEGYARKEDCRHGITLTASSGAAPVYEQ